MKKNASFLGQIKGVIKNLKEKEQDILMSYFGIEKDNSTLEAIGKRYKITRERVRQIKNNALSKIWKNAEKDYLNAISKVSAFVKTSGGIISEELLVSKFIKGDGERNAFLLSLFTNENLSLVKENDCHKKIWVYNGKSSKLVSPACAEFEKVLGKKKKPLKFNDLIAELKKTKFYQKNKKDLSNSLLKSIPALSKSIMKTEKGEWGLKKWTSINPKNTRDKIHYVLEKNGKPMHFRGITKEIAAGNFQGKNPAAPTVHNELIADKRFVLIGKGIYALAAWGYKPGTVADVLKDVLKNAKKGLTQENLIKEVLSVRQISKNTVIMNLRSQKQFVRAENSELWKLAK